MTPHTCTDGHGPVAQLKPRECVRCRELSAEIQALALLDLLEPTPGHVVRMAPRCEPGLDAFDSALARVRKILAEG